MVEIPIGPSEYNGPKTPFGGPSLEWQFSNITPVPGEESDEEARVGVRGIPCMMDAVLTHLRRILTQEYPRTTANIQRKVLATGLPIVEDLVEKYPFFRWKAESIFLSGKSIKDTREYLMNQTKFYVFQLGDREEGVTSIYARNKDQTNKIRNISKDMGLSIGEVTILCLAAGLAQSVDSSWVPIYIREAMIEEVRFFTKWLQDQKLQ